MINPSLRACTLVGRGYRGPGRPRQPTGSGSGSARGRETEDGSLDVGQPAKSGQTEPGRPVLADVGTDADLDSNVRLLVGDLPEVPSNRRVVRDPEVSDPQSRFRPGRAGVAGLTLDGPGDRSG